MKNPAEFKPLDLIRSVYSGKVYQVVEPDNKGMARLKLIECGLVTDCNAHNNRHFEMFNGQLEIEFN